MRSPSRVTFSEDARTSAIVHTIVKKSRIFLLAGSFVIASISSGVPPTVHADDPSDPTPSTSPDEQSADANVGPKNIVLVENKHDGRLRVKGHVQLGKVPGSVVSPVNLAAAVNTCHNDCDTLAVALQVNLVNRAFSVFTPQNAAVAVNAGCNGCHAVAWAIQYNIGVDDPIQVPAGVNKFVGRMRAEMAHIDASSTSLAQAESEMLGVIAQFQDLVAYLTTSRDEKITAPSPPEPQQPAAPAAQPAAPAPQPASAPSASPEQPAAPAAPPASAPSASPEPSQAPPPSPSPSPSPVPAPSPSAEAAPQASPSPP